LTASTPLLFISFRFSTVSTTAKEKFFLFSKWFHFIFHSRELQHFSKREKKNKINSSLLFYFFIFFYLNVSWCFSKESHTHQNKKKQDDFLGKIYWNFFHSFTDDVRMEMFVVNYRCEQIESSFPHKKKLSLKIIFLTHFDDVVIYAVRQKCLCSLSCEA
jgi:hypothetical protein